MAVSKEEYKKLKEYFDFQRKVEWTIEFCSNIVQTFELTLHVTVIYPPR